MVNVQCAAAPTRSVSLRLGRLARRDLGVVMADRAPDRRSRHSMALADEVTAYATHRGALNTARRERRTGGHQHQRSSSSDL